MHNHNMLEELMQLKKSKHRIEQIKLEKILNGLDDIKTAGMKCAERKCRKLHMGQVPYYPGLSHMAQTLIILESYVKEGQG